MQTLNKPNAVRDDEFLEEALQSDRLMESILAVLPTEGQDEPREERPNRRA